MAFGFPEALSQYGLKDWLRLIVIVCGYLILRPHLLKLAEKTQKRQHEREDQKQAEAEAKRLIDDPDKKDEDDQSSSSQPWRWGQKAVKRALKGKGKKPKTKEQIAAEMDSDEDVADLLQFDEQQQ
jgi:hypothetical protein